MVEVEKGSEEGGGGTGGGEEGRGFRHGGLREV